MIYSRWRPEGGYDYFETPERLPIGDDPPAIGIPSPAGGIGTPAQECGYQLPPGARPAGSGAMPRGLIVATYTGSVGDLSGTWTIQDPGSPYLYLLGGLVVGGLGYYLAKDAF